MHSVTQLSVPLFLYVFNIKILPEHLVKIVIHLLIHGKVLTEI